MSAHSRPPMAAQGPNRKGCVRDAARAGGSSASPAVAIRPAASRPRLSPSASTSGRSSAHRARVMMAAKA